MKIKQIAKTAHAVHLAYCNSMGLETQPVWKNLTDDHKQVIITSIRQILFGFINSVEESHQAFVKSKVAQGWMPGVTYNRNLKVNPRLVPYDELEINDRVKEQLFFECIKSFKK